MSIAFQLPQMAKIVESLTPQADSAGRTGSYATLKNAHKAYAVFHIKQGNAATVACSINQASDTSGTGAKAIPAQPIWSNLDTSVNDTLTSQTAAASYTTDAATKNKYVVFEIDPSSLDVNNGFRDIAMVTGASNAANITEGTLYIIPGRYIGAAPPTAVVD